MNLTDNFWTTAISITVGFCVAILGVRIISSEPVNSYYYVPDPVALKDGETQWLRVDLTQKARLRFKQVIYELDGIEYRTSVFIKATPTDE